MVQRKFLWLPTRLRSNRRRRLVWRWLRRVTFTDYGLEEEQP